MGVPGTLLLRSGPLGLWLHMVRCIHHPGGRLIVFNEVSIRLLNTHLFISSILISYLIALHRNWLVRWLTGASTHTTADELDVSDDEDEEDKEKEEKKTIKERLQAIQEVSQSVQNTIGYLASLGESVKK